MGREVRARIEQLREKMAERGMDAYLIPTSDFHGSEYVSGYFKCRKYMTGFTGSAGTAVITMEDAGLWTDGRYFVQAAAELSGSGVELYRSGQEGVPTMLEFLKKHMPEQGVLGFDGRVVDTAEGERIAKVLSGKKVRISEGEDLVEYKGTVIPVELEVYDADGQRGIPVPNSMEYDAAREIAANMGTSMNGSINISTDAGAQIASDLGKGVIQGVSGYVAKKMRTVKVTLKAGHRLLLHSPEQ